MVKSYTMDVLIRTSDMTFLFLHFTGYSMVLCEKVISCKFWIVGRFNFACLVVGRFLCSMLEMVMRWHQDKRVYEQVWIFPQWCIASRKHAQLSSL